MVQLTEGAYTALIVLFLLSLGAVILLINNICILKGRLKAKETRINDLLEMRGRDSSTIRNQQQRFFDVIAERDEIVEKINSIIDVINTLPKKHYEPEEYE